MTTGLLVTGVAGTGPVSAAPVPGDYDVSVGIDYTKIEQVAPGVEYKAFTVTTSHGSSEGHVLNVDLSNPRTSLELLHADKVAQGTTLTDMASDKGAFAAINADFFNMAYWENNPGLATESADGPEITNGEFRKAAVPAAQRIGPKMTTGSTGREVIGVSEDGRGRVDEVSVDGWVRSPMKVRARIRGYNQFALPQNSIGVYDAKWGAVTRKRATCGSDMNRLDPCVEDVTEVIVRKGRVVSVSDEAGSAQLGSDEIALLGRESGAAELANLSVGDPVNVRWFPVTSASKVPLRWAVGGFPTLVDGWLVAGLRTDLAPGTTAGVSRDGRTFTLAVVDGRSDVSVGVNLVELAELMRQFGVDDAIQLDRGGSTEMIMKPSLSATDYDILNVPSDGRERPFPNGIGVFVK
ncbi:phosphodiester glycosidase family protein [Micromonospora sp. DR5-3]|uniref:phosphodiester glycosidase family protein n=1 Tax=unclassified Micromonospora TaxID=2617518 RepID=UPI0011D839F5|nr:MULTISPECIES: phosphodiester glycosidase family protein [unclassified Micromonospora]MCW3819886.1 phosphodiester glycosidase family protein [Micromonospora sp. DR5-3]TYC20180.1 phosphodiester glycosidase family protein [Micromonospora sp. MP36]